MNRIRVIIQSLPHEVRMCATAFSLFILVTIMLAVLNNMGI